MELQHEGLLRTPLHLRSLGQSELAPAGARLQHQQSRQLGRDAFSDFTTRLPSPLGRVVKGEFGVAPRVARAGLVCILARTESDHRLLTVTACKLGLFSNISKQTWGYKRLFPGCETCQSHTVKQFPSVSETKPVSEFSDGNPVPSFWNSS